MNTNGPREGKCADIRLGISVGTGIATVYSLAAALVSLLASGGSDAPSPNDLAAVVGVYYSAGIMGGAVGGLLLPFRRHLAAALATGVIGAFFAACGFATLSAGHEFWSWDRYTWEAVAFVSAVLGGRGGYLYWRASR